MIPSPTDAELVAAHRAGDGCAFAELVGRHTGQMWGVAVRTLHDEDAAADAVQEALIRAHRSMHRFRGDALVGTWLHRILVNTCLDHLRRARARPTVRWDEHSVAAARSAARPDPTADLATRMAVTDALAELPDDQRVAIVLVDVQGFGVAEAAQVLEVPVGTVKSRCARGRTRLAGLLGHLREEA